MTQNTFVFDGHLTAVEPLTVSMKNSQGRLPRNGGIDAPAYWPATTIRGSLRHAAHRVVLMFNEDNKRPPFDLAEHFMLAQGVDIVGDISTPADDEVNAEQHLREGNPMLSLFGLWGLSSKANIGNGFPITTNSTALFGGGARSIMFERNPELLETLDQSERNRLQVILEEQSLASADIVALKDKQKELKKQLKTATSDEKTVLFEQIAALASQIQARKDQKGEARESIRRPIDQYEAICAGTVMEHRMSLKSVNQIELGFFIAVLLEFARFPRMGGHQAHNCGLVSGSWEVKTWPPKALSPVTIGSIAFDGEGFRVEGDALLSAYDAWCKDVTSSFHKVKDGA
ncbi:hypothetical protein ACET98_11240 [Aeromonas veronii]|uniref:hypothetical protein n=1 Tax=Aeromonas sp. R7-5 TaxID=3138477 RepID=UPI0034A5752C